ncbi:hypothetical protein SAMN02910340_02399 [Methanosarcina thermophila]|uniref:Uncharacterized protein n=2 Tax=Methanosarcina thermophila TaxID=2210 RepID=A0A1I7AWW0_METTE|nr:hypothetical protein SAMN02910340_02399 [Methanosarcina thermophila]
MSPGIDDIDVKGIGIFSKMKKPENNGGRPCCRNGIFKYEILPCRSFPENKLRETK